MPRGRKKTKVELTQDDILALKSLVGLAKQLTEQNEHVVGTQTSKNVVEAQKIVKKAKKKLKNEEDDGRSLRAGRSKRLKERQSGSPNYTRREPLNIPRKRVNLFDQDEDYDSFKEDTKIDKLLWKGKKVSRRGERTTVIEVSCTGCNNEFQINPNELKKDFDGKAIYVCNNCIRDRVELDSGDNDE